MSNDFLRQLEASHVRRMVDCMYERVYSQSQLVIQEGAAGNHLYVLAGKKLYNGICFVF